MLALLDTTVFVDFVGTDEPTRHASSHVLTGASEGLFDAVVALGSLQEVLHVGTRRHGRSTDAVEFTKWIADTFRIADHRVDDVATMIDLFGTHPQLGALDALIYASAERLSVDAIVTRDRGFGEVIGERWIDPTDAASLSRLLGAG